MTDSDLKYFKLLKDKVAKAMQKSYPGIPYSVTEWKGQNIIDFQTELQQKQNEHLSEKWFYTHMKSENSKLPRIDILNFLSRYVGCKSWEDFKYSNSIKNKHFSNGKSNRFFFSTPLLVVIILTVSYFIYSFFYVEEYTFSFYDSLTKQSILNNFIEVSVLDKKQSPQNYLCNTKGSFTLKTNKRKIEFVVETAYYRSDTIVRKLNRFNRHENVSLQQDDYAVMIHYFSNSNVKDWLKRKNNLDVMFSDNAKIFQVMGGTVGMEMYNKWEFINKLTLPSSGLRDIKILDTKYDGEKISHLRFIQNENRK